MAGSGTVTVKILGDATSLKAALGTSEAAVGSFSSRMEALGSRLTSIGRDMTMKLTLPIVAGFGLAAKAAADEDQEMAVLANTLKNTVGATDSQVAANERWITSMQNATGVADSQLRVAMGKLLIAGRDVTQSHADLAVAADIAAARHIDLDTVVTAMAKAANGQTTSLQRLGIATKDAAGNALSYDEILQNASKTMGGAAATAAATTAGQFNILKLKMVDLGESIGRILIPFITKLADWLGKLADWFQNLSPGMQQVIIGVLALVAVLGPLISVIGAVATALGFLAANPVVLVIAAIAALVVGLIYAYNHFEGFRNVVDSVIDVVQTVISGFIDFVSGAWQVFGDDILNIATGIWTQIYAVISGVIEVIRGVINVVMGLIHGDWSQAWDGIKQIVTGVWTAISGYITGALEVLKGVFGAAWNAMIVTVSNAWEWIKTAVTTGISDVIGFVSTLPGKVISALGNVATLLYNAGRAIIQGLINGITSMIGAVTHAIGNIVGVIGDFLPGSPVKRGPLMKLNNGYAGRQIAEMLAGGISAGMGDVNAAMGGIGGGGVLSRNGGTVILAPVFHGVRDPGHAMELLSQFVRGNEVPVAVKRAFVTP